MQGRPQVRKKKKLEIKKIIDREHYLILQKSFSHLSKVNGHVTLPETREPGEVMRCVWVCEFCKHVNNISLFEEEIPSADSMDFLLEPAPVADPSAAAAAAAPANYDVVFVVDVSGSMAVSTEIRGEPRQTEAQKALAEELKQFIEPGASQRLPGQRPGFSQVSRLQFLQTAVDTQLAELLRSEPEVRVALVSFSDEVTVWGDCRSGREPVKVRGDRLLDLDYLRRAGSEAVPVDPITASRARLGETVSSLSEGGQTALGPALVVAAAMASRAGSKVIVATDGVANLGVGRLDAETPADDFYRRDVAEWSKERGVSINVISIQGENSRLEFLGVAAEITGGTVVVSSPTELTGGVHSALADKIVATGVMIDLHMHRALRLRGPSAALGTKRDVGNVTAETSLSFEYTVAGDDPALEPSRTEVPFQVQIVYRRLDGSRCRRVITRSQKLTEDRAQAEAAANIGVLGMSAMQHSSNLVQGGDYRTAQRRVGKSEEVISRAMRANNTPEARAQYSHWQAVSSPFASEISNAVAQEAPNLEEQDESHRNQSRRVARNDSFSAQMYSAKASKKGFF